MADFDSSLPVRTQNNGDVASKIVDFTTPSQGLGVDASGNIAAKILDVAGNGITSQVNGAQRALDVGIDVAGVQIDPRQIRALTAADIVTSAQGAPNSAANGWPVKITDGTDTASVTALNQLEVAVTASLPTGANTIGAVNQGNAGSAAQGWFNRITDGTNVAAVKAASTAAVASDPALVVAISPNNQPISVAISPNPPGTEINDYNTGASIAPGASSNHDYTVSVGQTLTLTQIEASGSGKMKIQVQVETAAASGVFNTRFVQFNSTAETNMSIRLSAPIQVATGVRVRVIRTNRDLLAQDVYSTISGSEQ